MKFNYISIVYFSPTGGTERVAKLMVDGFGGANVSTLDMTVENQDYLALSENDLCVFCVPVYGGRVPSPVAERLSRVSGNGTAAALVAVFGNRAVDDALIELRDLTRARGFKTIAAAEFVAPHSLNTSFGSGRPDASDIGILNEFCRKIIEKAEADDLREINVPGSSNYRAYDGVPVKPAVSRRCVHCCVCASNCPVGAIDFINPQLTDKSTCISCMRCVTICPSGARHIPLPAKAAVTVMLKKLCDTRKEPKTYL